jgi:hypothetical protein
MNERAKNEGIVLKPLTNVAVKGGSNAVESGVDFGGENLHSRGSAKGYKSNHQSVFHQILTFFTNQQFEQFREHFQGPFSIDSNPRCNKDFIKNRLGQCNFRHQSSITIGTHHENSQSNSSAAQLDPAQNYG